jgi:hypothetical protein
MVLFLDNHITKHLQDALLLVKVRTLVYIIRGNGELKWAVTAYSYVLGH